MGLWDKLTSDSVTDETKRNFIKRPDEAKSQIIYRYPENNIRMLTQLTLYPDEMALFVKGGKVAGRLGEDMKGGTYTLNANNIPFLSNLLEKFTGGNLFVAELYFVNMREMPGQKFGGPVGDLTDAVTGMMVAATVFGEFWVKVEDAEKVVFKIAGSGTGTHGQNAFLDWFKPVVLAHLSDAIGELGEKGWSLNKMLSPHFKLELQAALVEQLKPQMQEYGLAVTKVANFVLGIPDDAKAELNKRNMAIADDQRRMAMAQNPAYMTVAQAEMMRGAGAGMAKGGEGAGGALTGMGMGMGLQMANMFGQNMQPQPHGQQQPPQQAPQQQGQVKCGSCGQMTPQGKFCAHCGKPVMAAGSKCDCGTELMPGAKFCPNCGKAAATGPKKCVECGTDLAPGAKFCANCGKPS